MNKEGYDETRQAYRICRKEKREMMWRKVEEIQQNIVKEYRKFYE
jgi:hypothetical protein